MNEIQITDYEILELLTTPPEIPYGVKMIGAELEWQDTRGRGVKVAVLDTGKPNHPDLRIVGAVDFTGSHLDDAHGHSTHVCGTVAANGRIKGVAPECELYAVKVLGDNGGGSLDWIANGIQWCIDNKMDVINLSLGSSQPNDRLHNIIKQAYASGITLVAAAGNTGQSPVRFPAAFPECIATVAVDIEQRRAVFSTRGVEAEIAAAGVEVHSTHLNGQYARLSGTSMACPHIAGAVAIMIAKARTRNRSTQPDFIRYALMQYADDLGVLGKDWDFGYGLFSFGRIIGGLPAPDRSAIDLRFEIGQKHYWRNGIRIPALTAPVIINSRAFLGLRDIGNALDAKVAWQSPFITISKT